jgi:hypothetical protein
MLNHVRRQRYFRRLMKRGSDRDKERDLSSEKAEQMSEAEIIGPALV